MSSLPAIVVAGQGRCGTSLMMQMLYAGGVQCFGDWPAFESSASMFGSFDPKAFAELRGRAIKLITPAELPIGPMPKHVVIWLDRDSHEQARSQLKMVADLPGVTSNRHCVRTMVAGIRRERSPNMAAVGANGKCPTLVLTFERLLTRTSVAMSALEAFLGLHGYDHLNFQAMRRQIRPRSPYCYPGMMEVDLLSEPPPGRPAM
ncbi:hypothetical protein EN781_00420 [Mesorhizobium sp. M4A.F.Ca.ET.090.04.2.1]|uniref:hypothetical protein n=1 Tax=Mesorhizobium sp. M4A.F.Ca.ET.090.04.2.1 TaxID=2496663 RepID=UPI000FCC229C|nr:hypothetical protein [Mesorhizobium sp. M4A.F.Ca.ET.090.04.2.1]RVC47633.1 hypothetical protein EN781_00420 [Mesorhizobium sp. M4A.F.Ca.ET.090.04.2.1]